MLKKIIQDFYWKPINLALRATRTLASLKGIDQFDEEGFRTNEFLNLYRETLQLAKEEPQIVDEMTKCPPFKASITYVREFLERNHFSLKQAHIARRGAICNDAVQSYIEKVDAAFIKFGEDHVFNMDETSVRIAYYPKKVVGIVGSDNVPVYSTLNTKECFTAVMTCTKNRTYPAIILAKGKTEISTKKFMIEKCPFEYQVWTCKNGWTDEEVMKRYLDNLKIIHPDPCALIVDSYGAHITATVNRYAMERSITIIQVPPNGTALYQPLDRKIFGIVKQKLRSKLGTKSDDDGENRYRIALYYFLEAWSEITQKHLNSAWKIPGVLMTDNDEEQ